MSLGFRSKVLSECGNNAISEAEISKNFRGHPRIPRTPQMDSPYGAYVHPVPPPPQCSHPAHATDEDGVENTFRNTNEEISFVLHEAGSEFFCF